MLCSNLFLSLSLFFCVLKDQVELTDANKALAEKIIRLRTYAFMLWQVFDTPADRRLFSLSQGEVSGVSPVTAGTSAIHGYTSHRRYAKTEASGLNNIELSCDFSVCNSSF
jgi:hypothetical protein